MLRAPVMPPADDHDLAALCAQLARRLADAERPILEAHGLSMWAYVALSHLARAPAGTQLELAQAIRYDKTRLIALLDSLEADGLITRAPDPADRRAKVVALTPEGRARRAAAQDAIRAMEADVLGALPEAERARLRRALARAVDAAS
jgi:MarR family transcriptional regulator, organic hydroperoxide resistance regulator